MFAEALIATEHQLAQVLAFMAQAVADRVMAALAELQAQVAGLVPVVQGVEGHQALNFAEEQAEDALRLQAGLQLQAQLLAQLRDCRGRCGRVRADQSPGVAIWHCRSQLRWSG